MLEKLRTDITRLIALYEKEAKRAEELSRELESSRAKEKEYKEQITELNSRIENLKLYEALSGQGDKALAKERIDRLVREIDKCISLLEH